MRHLFPFLLGRLPRALASLAGHAVVFGLRHPVEIMLAVPFVAVYLLVVVDTWDNPFFAQVDAIATCVLPLSYLVLCMMVRPRRDRPAKFRDEEV